MAKPKDPVDNSGDEIDRLMNDLVNQVREGTIKKEDVEVKLLVLNTAIKWYSAKHKVGDDDWGSDLGKGDEQ